MDISLYIIRCFSLLIFKILSLTFDIFIIMCLSMFIFWRLSVIPGLVYLFPSPSYESFQSLFLQIPFLSLSFSLLLLGSLYCECQETVLFQKSLKLSSFLKIIFSFYYSNSVISTTLPSRLLIHFSATSTLLLITSSVFYYFSYCIFQFCLVLFIFSISLLEFSLSSSILPPSLVSIFITITLNSLSGKLLISILFSSFSQVLSCSFIQKVFVSSFYLTLCIRFISHISQF